MRALLGTASHWGGAPRQSTKYTFPRYHARLGDHPGAYTARITLPYPIVPYPTLPYPPQVERGRLHMQTLVIYKLGFNQNYYTFTSILLIKIVLCSKFP